MAVSSASIAVSRSRAASWWHRRAVAIAPVFAGRPGGTVISFLPDGEEREALLVPVAPRQYLVRLVGLRAVSFTDRPA